MAHFLSSVDGLVDEDGRRYSFASDENETASDLSGPGRIVNNAISWAGQRINDTLMPTLVPASDSPFDITANGVGHGYSLASEDNDTASDLNGVGRTLDNALTWAGEHFEHWVGRMAERMGFGPNAVILDIIRASPQPTCTHQLSCRQAASTRKSLSTAVQELLVLRLSGTCSQCTEVFMNSDSKRAAKLPGYCRKLVKMLNDSSTSSRNLALQYLSIFALCSDDMRIQFLKLDVYEHLKDFCSSAWSSDPLLAPAQRALYALSDTKVLVIRKEVETAIARHQQLGPYCNSSLVVADMQRSGTMQLIQLSREPETQLLAISSLSALLAVFGASWVIQTFLQEIEEDFCWKLWQQALASPDRAGRVVIIQFVEYIDAMFSSTPLPRDQDGLSAVAKAALRAP